MAYKCPHCEGPIKRKYSRGAQMAGGLIGALLVAAFGDFQCAKCGPVAKSELAPEVRRRVLLGSIGMVCGAVILLVGLLVLLAYVKR